MSNVIKEIQTISLKQMDCINKNADNLNKLAEFVSNLQDNQKLLATKVLELEQRLNVANKGIERIDERSSN